MRSRVVTLAFDALDPDLVRKWAGEGLLPNFGRLLDGALSGEVVNPRGFEAGSVWPTFTTGQPLGVHGQYDGPYLFDTEAYELRLMRREDRVADPFWVHFSEAGRRVAIVDVPYVLLDEINGVHVVDWFTHVRTNPPGIASAPPAVARDILQRFGANPFQGENRCATNDAPVDSAEAVEEFRNLLLERIARKEAFCTELWQREPWDLFVAAFHDAHDAGHMCWFLHDQGHERHDPNLAAKVGNPLRDVYIALDAALGRMVALFGPDPVVLVYTSHGMGRQRTASRLLDDVLAGIEKAYRRQTEPPIPSTIPPKGRSWVERLAPIYRSVIPVSVRRRLVGTTLVRRAYRKAGSSARSQRMFFELAANHATGGVRFNLVGRERFGRVKRGEEFQALRRRLSTDLAAVLNAETKEALVTAVLWTRDHHDGPMSDALPDILLEWNKNAPVREVQSPLFGVITDRYRRPRSGDHTNKRGCFWMTGPGIARGSLPTPVPVEAFAPTIAHLLGCNADRYPAAPIAVARQAKAAE